MNQDLWHTLNVALLYSVIHAIKLKQRKKKERERRRMALKCSWQSLKGLTGMG